MSNINITIRMDEDLKKQADILFNNLGMTLTTALTIFTKQAVRERGIPFKITEDVPNKETREAFSESNEMATNTSKYKRYDNFDDLLDEVKNSCEK